MNAGRKQLADIIFERMQQEKHSCAAQYDGSKAKIGYFFIDSLLPADLAARIYEAFPPPAKMVLKKSLREHKYIAAQMDLYDPLLEEIIYAFQDARIVALIGEICGLEDIIPDENLYAGGISMMAHRQFLNPHLDNSHDKDRSLWRVLNLLYYVTPDWEPQYGANLELWPDGLEKRQVTIHSKFNRLVVMATHNHSLHSVSPVVADKNRCCVSNYYFSRRPALETDTFHVTSFRGRPENRFSDLVLKADSWLRMNLRKIFRKGIVKNPHVYKK